MAGAPLIVVLATFPMIRLSGRPRPPRIIKCRFAQCVVHDIFCEDLQREIMEFPAGIQASYVQS
jgi:hypothetical protein